MKPDKTRNQTHKHIHTNQETKKANQEINIGLYWFRYTYWFV